MRVLNLYCSNETPMSPADLADLRRQTTKHQNIKTSNHTNSLARTHRLFQKYQCRSVYTLTIRMLHILSSLFKCHHCVVCRNVISASLSPCQLELVSSQNMAYTHDVAVVDADVAILILHPLHNLRCREYDETFQRRCHPCSQSVGNRHSLAESDAPPRCRNRS